MASTQNRILLSDLDQDKFIRGALEMLDGVEAFWEGLDRHRITKYWRETTG